MLSLRRHLEISMKIECWNTMMVESTDFKNAMSLLTSAVNVVTTMGDTGRHGFTASAVCSVTDTPPTLLVCMNKSSRSHANFVENKVLCVNVLSTEQAVLSNAFASSKLTAEQRFAQGQWTELETGSPVLHDALVSFDCEIAQIQEVGTHTIFICPIVAIQKHQQDQALVYFNRAYHHVGETETV